VITFRELTDEPADLALLSAFYATLYENEFPDPDERESLENMADYLRRKAQGWYEANNYHIVLAISGTEILAGVIFDYLAEPRAGVIEFLLVSPTSRGTGVGGQLLAHAEELLRADAGGELHAIAAEVNDPLVSPAETDNLNPVTRALIWQRWGYRGVDFPYVQPPLSPEQDAVTTLILICKPLREDWAEDVPAAVVDLIVREYLRWAMRIEQPDDCPEYRLMADHLAARKRVGLLALDRYAGTLLPVDVIQQPDEPDFDATMKLYQAEFPPGPLSVSEDEFRHAMRQPPAGLCYHLWTVRGAAEPAGFASFFTLSAAGFLGYVALTGEMRGAGRFRELAARIETQLLADRASVRGWYAEVGPDTATAPFLRLGFRHLAVDYRQPPGDAPARLLFKPMGRIYTWPQLRSVDLLTDLAELLRGVYGIADPERHPSYTRIAAQVPHDGAVPVVNRE
jgi:GNAT superfamily N-acetyltransferase